MPATAEISVYVSEKWCQLLESYLGGGCPWTSSHGVGMAHLAKPSYWGSQREWGTQYQWLEWDHKT